MILVWHRGFRIYGVGVIGLEVGRWLDCEDACYFRGRVCEEGFCVL